MRKINKLLVHAIILFMAMFFTLHVVDLAQSYYFLNEYGFEHEMNELVTDNFSLFAVKLIVIGIMLTWVVCIKISLWYETTLIRFKYTGFSSTLCLLLILFSVVYMTSSISLAVINNQGMIYYYDVVKILKCRVLC